MRNQLNILRRPVKKIFLISFLILISYIPSFAQNLLVVYPRNGTVVFSDQIHVVGYSEKDLPVTISLGKDEYFIKSFKNLKTKDGSRFVFMKTINIKSGSNDITVSNNESVQRFQVILSTTAVAYRDKIEQNVFFHMDENKYICKSCHDFNEIKDCQTCHKGKNLGKYIHGPVAAWQCLQCHDKNNFFAPIQPISSKCLQCHQEFSTEMFNAKYAHGPSVAGYCNICHNPHNSDKKFLLQDSTNELCNNCHTDKKSGVHVLANFSGNVHPTSGVIIKSSKEELSCVSCHNPHFGKVKQLYQGDNTDFINLCIKCHPDKL